MKKFSKILVIVLALATLVGACFVFAACNDNEGATKVKVLDFALTEEAYAFAVPKGDTEMLNAANELLDELKSTGQLAEIINSFFEGTATFTYTC